MIYIDSDNRDDNYKSEELKFKKLLNSIEKREKNVDLQPDRNVIGENTLTTEEINEILLNRKELKDKSEKNQRDIERETYDIIKLKPSTERIDLYSDQVYDVMPSFNVYNDNVWNYKFYIVNNFIKAISTLQIRNRVENRISLLNERIKSVDGNVQYMVTDDNNVYLNIINRIYHLQMIYHQI